MERFQQQAVTARFDRGQIFLAAHGDLTQPHLLRSAQGVANHAVCVLGQIVGGHKVVGSVEVDRRNLATTDKLDQFECLLRLQFDRIDLVRLQQDVFAVVHLVPFDNVVGIHRTDAGDRLFVTDTLSRGFVDLAKRNSRSRVAGGIKFNRNRDQRQPQLSFPKRTRSHMPPLPVELYLHANVQTRNLIPAKR